MDPSGRDRTCLLAEAADAAAGLEKIPEIFGGRRIDGWRRCGEELVQNREEMFERFGELSVLSGVFRGEACDAAGGFGVVVVEEEGFAIGRRSEETRVGMHDVALEFFELHVRGDIGAKGADGVGERGGAEAGMKFFGDGAAADEFAALED